MELFFHKVKKKLWENRAFGGQKIPQTEWNINLGITRSFLYIYLCTSSYFNCFHAVFGVLWVDELFLVWACQNKKFHFIGGSRGACLLANAERKKPGARGNPRPEVPHYMRPGYLIMLCFQAFYLSFLQHFARSFSKKFHLIHKNSMSTFTGLVRLFSRRTARVLSSKNVANTLQSSCRARSIFAATTRGASQNLRYAIPCACTKVCACEVHKYTQGWFYK